MKFLFSFIALSAPFSAALANPGVTKGTDVHKRKSVKHYQVTRCEGEKCEVSEVTEFDKSFKPGEEGKYVQTCFFSVVGKKRFMSCQEKEAPKEVVVEKIVEKPVEKKVEVVVDKPVVKNYNRISVLGSYGLNGLETSESEDSTSIKEKFGPVLGLSYSRLVTDEFSVGAFVQTNKNLGLSIGFDF